MIKRTWSNAAGAAAQYCSVTEITRTGRLGMAHQEIADLEKCSASRPLRALATVVSCNNLPTDPQVAINA